MGNSPNSGVQHLVICRDLGGRSSTGIEVMKWFQHLANSGANVHVLTANASKNDINVTIIPQRFVQIHERIQKLLLVFLGWDIYSIYPQKKLDPFTSDYSLKMARTIQVHALTSSADFYVIDLLCQLLRRMGNKISVLVRVHFFDPIPAKSHWGEMERLRQAKIKYLKKRLKPEWSFSAASGPMAEYMRTLYGLDFKVSYSRVVKGSVNFTELKKTSKNPTKRAYYLGSLYGQRDGSLLIKAFLELIEWELHIFGTEEPDTSWGKNVFFEPFIEDINTLEKPDLLIDLDVSVPDVFIPGKSYTYLASNVPILAITPVGSAMREFYQEQNKFNHSHVGVRFCDNSIAAIKESLEEVLHDVTDFVASRNRLIEEINKSYFG